MASLSTSSTTAKSPVFVQHIVVVIVDYTNKPTSSAKERKKNSNDAGKKCVLHKTKEWEREREAAINGKITCEPWKWWPARFLSVWFGVCGAFACVPIGFLCSSLIPCMDAVPFIPFNRDFMCHQRCGNVICFLFIASSPASPFLTPSPCIAYAVYALYVCVRNCVHCIVG